MARGEIPIGVVHEALAEAPRVGVFTAQVEHRDAGVGFTSDRLVDVHHAVAVVALEPVLSGTNRGVLHCL